MFKCCTACNQVWHDRHTLLSDGNLILNGYQANFNAPEKGLFIFTHTVSHCNTTFAVEVEMFVDLFHGTRYEEARTGMEDCTGKCLIKNNLERCDAHCKFAFVRDLMSIIENYKKSGGIKLEKTDIVTNKGEKDGFFCKLVGICFRRAKV